MNHHLITTIVVIALICLGIYRRVRRNIGWQRLKRGNLVFRTVIFLVIGLLFLVAGLTHPISIVSDVIGVTLGAFLGVYGVNLTRFEQREGRLYYCPNIWVGTAVTLLFLGRLIYRFYTIYSSGALNGAAQQNPNQFQSMAGNSWAAGLLLIMFAYYIFYYAVLLKKQKQFSESDQDHVSIK